MTYHQYVTELTYLLFLMMAKETGQEQGIPEEWRWDDLEQLDGTRQLNHCKLLLLELGTSESGSSPLVQEIYANAWPLFSEPHLGMGSATVRRNSQSHRCCASPP